MKEKWKKFSWIAGMFLVAYLLPLGSPKVKEAIYEAFRLLQWYAREHTLACVVACAVYCRGDYHLSLPGVGDAISGAKGK